VKTHVAIVQAAPVALDLAASVEKGVVLIREAASRGAKLVAFGETWLPGYPIWLDYCPDVALWNHGPAKEVFARLRRNSVEVPGPETERFAALARELDLVIVLGVNERAGGTLYNTLLTFAPELVRHHRKLVPTYSERMVWGNGDGHDLGAAPTAAGRVGGLICWEHWMPLARQAMHDSNEEIHVAVWPTAHEMHQVASRHYAFEGRCFVLACGAISPVRDLPPEFALPGDPERLLQRGGSAIIAPNGSYVAGPVFDEETILDAEIDLGQIDRERMTLDVSGHYARPDVFSFEVRPGAARRSR
jgi:predicted amidohydrolase